MSVKEKKYIDAQHLLKTFEAKNNHICLITHINDLNSLETKLLKIFCDEKRVDSISIKLNLLKKFTKNDLFNNLFAGPTKIFFFSDLLVFKTFFKQIPLEKKIVPLAIFFDNKFFSYTFFQQNIEKITSEHVKTEKELTDQLILNLNQNSKNFINNINHIPKSFMLFLSLLKNKLNK